MKRWFKWVIEIVKRNQETKGFKVLPRRWVVERTFAWFGRYRRLSKDYEYLPSSSETMLYIAMINVMLRRLTRSTSTTLIS
jgi:putative transposase